ncbi:MAG: hypothetical protein ACT4UQ_08450 [Gammaproteobacteria bacterium]
MREIKRQRERQQTGEQVVFAPATVTGRLDGIVVRSTYCAPAFVVIQYVVAGNAGAWWVPRFISAIF